MAPDETDATLEQIARTNAYLTFAFMLLAPLLVSDVIPLGRMWSPVRMIPFYALIVGGIVGLACACAARRAEDQKALRRSIFSIAWAVGAIALHIAAELIVAHLTGT